MPSLAPADVGPRLIGAEESWYDEAPHLPPTSHAADTLSGHPTSEDELILRAKGSDERSVEALLKRYEKLVRKEARKFAGAIARRATVSEEDLIQEGRIGVLTALRFYEPREGGGFARYARPCVRRSIRSAAVRLSHAQSIPEALVGDMSRLRAIRARGEEGANSDTPLSLTHDRKLNPKRVRDIEEIIACAPPVSLDAPLESAGGDYASAIEYLPETGGDPASFVAFGGLDSREECELHEALGRLSGRQRTLLGGIYGLHGDAPETQKEMAARMGVTDRTARTLQRQAERELRLIIAQEEPAW